MSPRDLLPADYPGLANDPVAYAQEILGVTLTDDQRAILLSLLQAPHKTLVLAGTNVGKTFVAAIAVSWFYDCFRPSICLTTAPKLEQVRDLLWKEIRTLREGRELNGFPGPKALRLQSAPDHFAAGIVARDGTRFQGRHSAHVMIVFDECTGVDPVFWDRALPMLQGERYFMLAIGNPTDISSRAYDEYRNGGWNVLTMSSLNHPNIKAELAGQKAPYPSAVRLETLDAMLRKWCTEVRPGEQQATDIEWPIGTGKYLRPGPEAEALLLGHWPSTASNSVWSEAVFDAACKLVLPPGGRVQIGCDVARFGRDWTVLVVQQSGTVLHLESHNGWSTKQTADRCRQLCRDFACGADPRRVPVVVDDTGVGGGDVDQADGFYFVPINAATVPFEPDKYPKKRDELFFGVVEAARVGRVSFAKLSPAVQQELRRQALAPTYTLDYQGRRKVESKDELKKRLGRSCDELDALNLVFCAVQVQPDRVSGRVRVS